MKVFHDLNNLPTFKNAVVTIGSFDGVHTGHQKIIEKVNQLARSINGESIIITFHPHPRQIVYPKDDTLKLLTTIEEKIELFERYGADNVVVAPFTIEFSQLSADEYIQKFLVGKFHPKHIVIGYDHRFGLNRQGDIHYLKWYGKDAGYEVLEIEKQEVEDIAVSSSKVRKALEKGDVRSARQFLGHFFTLTGPVVHGQAIGLSLGFPTANLDIRQKHKLIPPSGIYAVLVYHQGTQYRGMLYIGDRPTIKEYSHRTIEVNIFDFDKLIYGETLKLELVEFLRGDTAFETLEDLKVQLSKDRANAQKVLEAKAALPEEKKISLLPRVAVVILNFNGKKYLQRFLPYVLATIYLNIEVVVADNGSTDGSVDFLKENFPSVSCIQIKENQGFARGYNLALEQVDAPYYILLNSDVEVLPGWIDPIIKIMEADPSIGACQPKIRSYTHREQFEYAGAAGGWIDFLGYPFCRGRIFAETEDDQGQYDYSQEIFWATGAALFIRAELFRQIGGFDEDYFAHSEEIDLCWRIKRAGYRIVACPESMVFHLGGGTLTYNTPQKTYFNFRNSLYNLLKNEPASKLFWLLPLRMLLDGLAGGLFLSQGKFQHIRSILKAHWTFYLNFFKMAQKRKMYFEKIKNAAISDQPNLSGIYKGSVVWQYYARKKHTFREIVK